MSIGLRGFSVIVRKNGKKIRLFRKLCEDCLYEYVQELGEPDRHECPMKLTQPDRPQEIYDILSDEKFADGQ